MPEMDQITMHEADVVVCGAGLAGMRAALSAAGPDLRTARQRRPAVLQLAVTAGPSGSSFANRNDVLGILAPQTPYHAELLEQRITEIAGVSYLDRDLVRILLADAPARVRDLEYIGVRFQAERHTACFYPDAQVARLFSGLSGVHGRYADACSEAGVVRLSGMTIVGLLLDTVQPPCGPCVCGVVATDAGGGVHVISASAVILALGGPAPLFASHVAGPHNSGAGYGLLRSVGAHVGNASFLQFMWYGDSPCRFVSAAQAVAELSHDVEIGTSLPEALLRQRETHCPYAWHLPDNAVDHVLLERADASGVVTHPVRAGGMLLMAHAGNGGAVIDAHGQTSVPGLFACGECATGMHGANRIGGAMVLATQVFGHRAGEAAARMARSGSPLSRRRMLKAGGPFEEWQYRMKMENTAGHAGRLDRSVPGFPAAHAVPEPREVPERLPVMLYQACSPMGLHCNDTEQGSAAAGRLEHILLHTLAEGALEPLQRMQVLSALEIVQHALRIAGA